MRRRELQTRRLASPRPSRLPRSSPWRRRLPTTRGGHPRSPDRDPGPEEADWGQAVNAATRYGRPERTSEGDVDDGSHYTQSIDDQKYAASCDEGIMGFHMTLRENTKSVHWRYLRNPGGWWRVYFNGEYVGPLGDGVIRVADTNTRWYEFRPPRLRREGEFVLLVVCGPDRTVDDLTLELHYHH